MPNHLRFDVGLFSTLWQEFLKSRFFFRKSYFFSGLSSMCCSFKYIGSNIDYKTKYLESLFMRNNDHYFKIVMFNNDFQYLAPKRVDPGITYYNEQWLLNQGKTVMISIIWIS